MRRIVEPEILDHLSPQDPAAIRSRKDLQRLNWIMGHASILTHALRKPLLEKAPQNRPLRIAELGGGDGSLLLRLAKRWTANGIRADATLVDQSDLFTAGMKQKFKAVGWSVESIVADAVQWLNEGSEEFDLIFANLLLHHFEAGELRTLFEATEGRCAVFLACDPRRDSFALAASRMVGLIGCNSVTRNDAVLSVRAGFTNKELTSLWPSRDRWRLVERRAGLFSHLFLAVKE